MTSGVGREERESIALHHNIVAVQLKHMTALAVSLSCLNGEGKKEEKEVKTEMLLIPVSWTLCKKMIR